VTYPTIEVYCPVCRPPRTLIVLGDSGDIDVRPHRVRTDDGGWATTTEWPYPVECKKCRARGHVDTYALIWARGVDQQKVRVPLTIVK
jgi:hypothetical protein